MTDIEILTYRLEQAKEAELRARAEASRTQREDPYSKEATDAQRLQTRKGLAVRNITRQLLAARLRAGEEVLEVSDHAVIRYLERVGGIDIEEIKSLIATPEVKRLALRLGGSGKGKLSDGREIIFKRGKIITII